MQKETVNIYKLKDQGYVNYVLCCFEFLSKDVGYFEKSRIPNLYAYKIVCLIIDWNGSRQIRLC